MSNINNIGVNQSIESKPQTAAAISESESDANNTSTTDNIINTKIEDNHVDDIGNQTDSNNNDSSNTNIRNGNVLQIGWTSIIGMINIWKKRDFFVYLLFLSIFSGTNLEFITGEFPLFIKDKAFKFYVLGIYGFISAVFSYIFGKLSDNATIGGRILVLKIACAAHSLYYFLCLFLVYNENLFEYKNDLKHMSFFIILGILVGIGDGGLFTQLLAVYPCIIGKVNSIRCFLFFVCCFI